MSIEQNIEQKRAKFALEFIEIQQKKLDKNEQKQLKSYLQTLPAMIQMNGFGQSIAFYKAHPSSKTGGNAYQAIYKTLSQWLCQQKIYSSLDLLKNITINDIHQYQLATAETQSLLVWLKKFARAYLVNNKEEE